MRLRPPESRQVVLLDSEGSKKGLTPEEFSSFGIELLAASTSREALETLSSTAAGVLLVDIQALGVPQISAVRKNLPDLAIVVMLGFNDGNLISDTQLGKAATTILTQPFTPTDIVGAIRHAFLRSTVSRANEALKMNIEPSHPRVLLVEDDETQRRLVSARLEKHGYQVASVEDGTLALEVLESRDFDIVVTDIMMPRMDGIELTRKAKALKPGLPVIVCSATNSSEASLNALRAGAYCYVLKPVNVDELSLFMDRARQANRLEGQLREQNALLERRTEELARALGEIRGQGDLYAASRRSTVKQLSAKVSHELKNPINSISASFYYVRSQLPETLLAAKPKITKHCDIIENQIQRSKNLIERMLEFGRPEMTRVSEIQVNDLLTEAIAQVLPEPSGITVRMELDSSLPRVKASKTKLATVFVNLLANAAKAMKNDGVLTVTSASDGVDNVRITVADTGPGIAPSIIHKIFDPFFTTDLDHGTGLGLSICREAVVQQGGTIAVDNAPQGGAVFTVKLLAMKSQAVLA
jgi:signal transduction histidine kinase